VAARKRSNPDFLNGVPELLILQLLERRPMYGYQLVRQMTLATNRKMEFGEGCIYPLLHRLEAEGSLASRREKCDGRSRIVYRVTGKGQGKLAQTMDRWAQVVESVQRVLQGVQDGEVLLT
jgi:PadR family transcriptional regulator PadR